MDFFLILFLLALNGQLDQQTHEYDQTSTSKIVTVDLWGLQPRG